MPRTHALLRLVNVLAAVWFSTGAGCLDDGAGNPGGTVSATASTTTAPPHAGACDADLASLPLAPNWAGHGGTWSGFAQTDAQRPVGQRGAGRADPGLGLLIDHAQDPRPSVAIDVDVALVSGAHPDGAGIVFHWTGPSYNIVRFSPSEGGWHAFTVIDGERSKIDPLPLAGDPPEGPAWCEWVSLRVVAVGADVKAFQDGQVVLEFALPEAASLTGQAGLFVRGDSVALFAGYQSAAI